jgi:hydroxypyruvate reductase
VNDKLQTTAQQIFHRTLAAIDVESVVRARLRRSGDLLEIGEEKCDLTKYQRVIVIAIGKASIAMARAVGEIIGRRVTDGVIVTNAPGGVAPGRLPVLLGGHPLPNAASFAAAEKAVNVLRANDAADTLVLFLISGGGSAMFEAPIDPSITLDDLQAVNRLLVGCGAVINEMNIVRRRLSAVKGGKLAGNAPRSRQISLYISDVNSDDLTTVASGPTLPDNSTVEDFYRIISRYDLLKNFPPHLAVLVAAGKISDSGLSRRGLENSHQLHSHHLLLDNRRALAEAQRIAEDEFGLVVEIADDLVEGEVEEMARIHLERVRTLRDSHPARAVCLLSGGEVICPVRGAGQGGRNQEFVLRAAIMLAAANRKNIVALSAGTDGIDGHSPAAGAIAHDLTIQRAEEVGLSAETYLRNSDSFSFFNALGDAIITGPTGNNVRDLRILIAC